MHYQALLKWVPRYLVCLLACVLVGGALLSSSFASAQTAELLRTERARVQSAEGLALFQGEWQRTDSEEAETARISSIDKAINGLTWVVRKMAGGVLRSSTKPPSEVQFVWDGSALHQRVYGDNGSFIRPVQLGADPIEALDDRGDPFISSWKIADEGLSLTWEQHQAYGQNLYRLNPDGQTLEIEHTINVTALSGVEPIVYRSQFRRNPGSPPSVAGGPVPESSAP